VSGEYPHLNFKNIVDSMSDKKLNLKYLN